MSQLFIVYLGGSAQKANIELHDIQFVVGELLKILMSTLEKTGLVLLRVYI